MSGSWESAMVDEALRYGDFTTTRSGLWHRYTRSRAQGDIRGLRPLTTYSKSQREAFEAAVDMVKAVQLTWQDIPAKDAIWELRRGEASIFYPLFKEDPTIWVECPSPRVHNPGMRVTADYRGECSDCGYDLVGGTLTTERSNEK